MLQASRTTSVETTAIFLSIFLVFAYLLYNVVCTGLLSILIFNHNFVPKATVFLNLSHEWQLSCQLTS